MENYIDGFVFPVPKDQLNVYKEVAEKVAAIWIEYGALDYSEFVEDGFSLEGPKPFTNVINKKNSEVIIFGWIVFESLEARDFAHNKVSSDPRMPDLIKPLSDPSNPIFDVKQMVYGGFKSLVQLSKSNK